jgi:hypothetical protein
MADLLLEFLQKLMSAGDVLGSLDWVLLGVRFGRCGHGICSRLHPNPTQARVERTLLSAAFDVALARRENRIKTKTKTKINTKSGGQECPPYTLLAPAWGWALRLFFKDRELNLLLNRVNPVHQYPYAIAQAVGLTRALADDLARGFVVGVAVVG